MTAFVGPTPFELQHMRLEAEVAELMGVINAATARLVDAAEEVVADGIWNVPGIRSPAQWMMWRAGVSAGRAKSLVAMARRKAELPELMGLFAAGGVTEDAMRMIAAKVPAERDGEVARLAPELLHSQLRRVLSCLPDVLDAKAERDRGPALEPERSTRFGYRDDGWWELHSLLPADEGALAQKALEAAREAEFADRKGDHDNCVRVGWSDALGRLARAGLDGLDPAVGKGKPRGERFQAIFHINTDSEGDPLAHLHLGPALPDALRRYLLCDAKVRAAIERDGALVGISPLMPTVDVRLRHQIEERDRGRRFPGCSQQRWTHVHHIVHREDHGLTVPSNLCVLCPFHHRLHHQGAYRIEGDPSRPDGLRFTERSGQPIAAPRPQRPAQLPPQGAPPAHYTPPSGEHLHTRWFTWN